MQPQHKYLETDNNALVSDKAVLEYSMLKPHHHIRLDKEFRYDCQVWLEFLQDDNMERVVSRPMIDLLGPVKTSEEIAFYSDASGTISYGSVLDKRWIYGLWDENFLKLRKPSIEYLELFALTARVITWMTALTNCRIIVFCDNVSVVHMINSMTSGCKNCIILIRLLILNGLQYNRRIAAHYINMKQNILADALSRNMIKKFKSLAPQMNVTPDDINENLWPMEKLWFDG